MTSRASGAEPPNPVELAADAAIAFLRPRMRGWLHAYAAVLSVISGTVLVACAATLRGLPAAASTGLYAITVTLLFGVSASYHRFTWKPRAHRLMRRLDHSMIFIFIAGTYTALLVNTLPRDQATWVLSIVWVGATAGVLLKVAWPHSPAWIGVPCYIGLGWVAVLVFPELIEHGGVAAFVLLLAGGIAYTIGGIIYGVKRPNPSPANFGYHEIFHLATIIGAVCHYIAIWLVLF